MPWARIPDSPQRKMKATVPTSGGRTSGKRSERSEESPPGKREAFKKKRERHADKRAEQNRADRQSDDC